MPEHNHPPSMLDDMRTARGLVWWVLWGTASTIQVPLRRFGTVGIRFFGAKPIVGMIFMPVLAGILGIPDRHPESVFIFWIILVVMCGLHRLTSYRRMRRGWMIHRHYVGQSVISRLLPNLDESHARRCDALFGFAFGAAFASLGCFTLAFWFPIAGMASLMTTIQLSARDRYRDDAMRDALLEQMEWADRVRRMDPNGAGGQGGHAPARSDAVYRPKFIRSRIVK